MSSLSARDRQEFFSELQVQLKGQVLSDRTSRWLYSTDASIYQIQPAGVVIPHDLADLQKLLPLLQKYSCSLVARGGGTSLGGQAVGPGLQLDLSRHFQRILEINPEAGWVRVQPGVVLDQLNQALKPYGLWFGPDVAPSNRATLGGMIGNNSSGARSIIYGKTQAHVLELKALLADGSRVSTRPLDQRSWQVKAQQNSQEGKLYHWLATQIPAAQDEISRRFPQILRRVSGYNLDAFLDPHTRSLSDLLVGSEGTLALIYEAKLKVVPRPRCQGLLLIYCQSLTDALEANHHILETAPSAAELIDEMLLALTRESPGFASKLYFMEAPAQALLLVEYLADSPQELQHKLEQAQRFVRQQGLGNHTSLISDPRVQADIWAIRKAGMPLLYSRPGDYKPITFVEDAAVAPERLREFIQDFEQLVQAHNTQAAYYAHASVGCLHIRPLIDLKQASEVRKMRSLAEGVLELVLRYQGAMSGEHGDGLARSEFNPRLFGPQVYQLFQELKQLCDPQGLFNPGKIVNAPPMDQNLRLGEAYQPQPFKTELAYSQQGSFQQIVELCNGNAACRKLGVGTMCPPFQITHQEHDNTRGRANALRRLLLEPDLTTQDEAELYQVMDLCIGCKACKSECPSKVDMAKLKSEFLHHYQQRHGMPLRSRLLGNLKWLNHLGSLGAPVSNQLLRFRPLRLLLEQQLGLSADRRLPPFAAVPFEYSYSQRPPAPAERPAVLLFNDCYMNYNHPEVGQASLQLIEAMGYRAIVLPQQCCGRPWLSLGGLKQARSQAGNLLRRYQPYLEQGLEVVGAEPSCLLSFRDEYPDLWPQAASALAQQSFTLQEWLLKQAKGKSNLPFGPLQKQIFYHEHCHQQSLVGPETTRQALQLASGFEVQLSQAGCCGMAGSFGYEAEHSQLSQQIAAERLVPALKAHPQAEVAVSGISCRHQIAQESGRTALHWSELLAQALVLPAAEKLQKSPNP